MQKADGVELMIRFGMPIAAAGSVFLMTLLSLIFFMDKYIFSRDTGSSFILAVGFGLNILGIVYCFRYSRNVLGYFADPEKKMSHAILFVIIPILLGLAMAFQGYQSRMIVRGKSPQIDAIPR